MCANFGGHTACLLVPVSSCARHASSDRILDERFGHKLPHNAIGGDAAAATRTAALARHLHDECNRAVDRVWSKPNKKGDLLCIFEDSSDDETVAAR